jgi:predicted AlkP superfamily pyrophosphatase or phosphodiesterase
VSIILWRTCPFLCADRKISDAANAEKSQTASFNNDFSFAFVTFSGFMNAASLQGTDDVAVDVAVRQTEKLLCNVLQTAEERYKDVVFFFFSDQGMAGYHHAGHIETKARKLDWRLERLCCFYEQTMVPFLVLTADARESIIEFWRRHRREIFSQERY